MKVTSAREISEAVPHPSVAHGPLDNKTSRSLVIFVAMIFLSYSSLAVVRHRLPVPQAFNFIINPPTDVAESSTLDEVATDSPITIVAKPGEIEDPSGRALDKFFQALLNTEGGRGQTKICHYGDSPITNDGITSTVRRKLQLKFGDAGHGFVLIDRPWGWYEHTGVIREASHGWNSDPICISRGEHYYGLGGVSFLASAAGTNASFSTAIQSEVGRSVSSYEVYYMKRPAGGEFDIEMDGQFVERVSTASREIDSGFHRVEVPLGAHRMTIRLDGNGAVQMFGVTLESNSSGVQYDSLGVNGAFIGLLAQYIDSDHWKEQLQHRAPSLVIIGYGTNESQFEKLPMDQYERDTREVIRRIRASVPNASIMLVGPMDRGCRGANGGIVTRPMIPKLVRYQRRIAAETGCAFFDEFAAMGGEGTVARWCEARPRLMGGDYTHPTAQGAEIVGSLLYDAILRAYEEYKSKSDNSDR